ncbi:MAG TPA: hypothetical protein PK072_06430 [Quisquiliibacterium sp.]|nr:hypothetical protein [Quisquiliibacterium sp.]HQP66265.1 hypothetical protein [Quisquiliibacterium sp.]
MRYTATAQGELLRHAADDGRITARVMLGFEPRALAVAGGPGALVLVAGRGRDAISVHDPESLATVRRYALPDGRSVVAALDLPGRARFALGFSDRDELWEIAYGPDAPPVLLGLVHDYRSNEAVPLPGRLTPRPFRVPGATRALLPGAVPRELLRIDASGRVGVVDLEVRREIERPAHPPFEDGVLAAAWRQRDARGWLIAARGSRRVDRLRAGDWRLEPVATLPGEVLALAASPGAGEVHALHAGATSVGVVRIDPVSAETVAIPYDADTHALLRQQGTRAVRCPPPPDGAGERALSRPPVPGTPAGNAAPQPTR